MNQHSIKRQVKNNLLGIYGYLQSIAYDSKKTIFVSGAPRSGTSWLGEMLAQPFGSILLWEPFHLKHQPELKKLGFEWRTNITKKSEDRLKRKVLEDLIKGKRLNHHTLKDVDAKSLLKRKRYVIKSVRSNWFLGLLANEYQMRIPICIVRHPCAVVSSQMHRRTKHQTVTEQKSIENWSNGLPAVGQTFLSFYPQFEHILKNLNTWEEILATRWCMDNIELITTNKSLPYIVVSYEHFVTSGENTLKSLYNYLEIEWKKSYKKGLGTLSSTVVEGSNVAEGSNPLVGWKQKLSPQQTSNILNIVRKFGCSFYGKNVEPDYKNLNKISAQGI